MHLIGVDQGGALCRRGDAFTIQGDLDYIRPFAQRRQSRGRDPAGERRHGRVTILKREAASGQSREHLRLARRDLGPDGAQIAWPHVA